MDDVWTMPASPSGLETLVLLAREDSPLPREDESRLAEALAGSPVALPAEMSEAIWLEDGQEVVFGPSSRSQESGARRGGPEPRHPQPQGPQER